MMNTENPLLKCIINYIALKDGQKKKKKDKNGMDLIEAEDIK